MEWRAHIDSPPGPKTADESMRDYPVTNVAGRRGTAYAKAIAKFRRSAGRVRMEGGRCMMWFSEGDGVGYMSEVRQLWLPSAAVGETTLTLSSTISLP
ncbi:uncharacterized protein A4U43_C09F15730 [Asparagus officinalis]|uniref:Uncharacterized protein n=1 Tax=Asparagus officinalis TaxID=4686 RepID=A0A5P1ECP6_ASPOF|nr:uncharacterized protein A4U43_C09F15730 [Asparagus officinalis]